MKTLDKMTKAELINVINTKDAELAVLRAAHAVANTYVPKVNTPARPHKEHVYASHAEACENCRRLSAEPALARWTFSVVDNRVICRQRIKLAA